MFNVVDSTDTGLEALITVDDERTSAWGIQQTMTTANDGSAVLTLPDTSLNLIVSKPGYKSKVIEYQGSSDVTVSLEVSDGYYRLTGLVTAEGFDFRFIRPELKLTMSDESVQSIRPTTVADNQVQFEWIGDVQDVSPQTLTVTHRSADAVELALRPDLGEEEVSISLIGPDVAPAPGNADNESGQTDSGNSDSGSSGGGNAAWLLVTALALIGRRRLKTS